MHFQNSAKYDRVPWKDSKRVFLVASLSLLLILGFGIICYDDDLSDNNDPPVIALQCPIILPANDEISFIELTIESIRLPLINQLSLPVRAPPT